MKGQSQIVSVVLSILLQSMVVGAAIYAFSEMTSSYKESLMRDRAYHLCRSLRSAILLHHHGIEEFSVPGNMFRVVFNSSKILIPEANASCEIPGFSLHGSFSGSAFSMEFQGSGTVRGMVI